MTYSLSTNADLFLGFLFAWECGPPHSASGLFGQTFSGSAVIAAPQNGQLQRLRRDGFCGRQISYGVSHMPN
jgi:hypothetical protein